MDKVLNFLEKHVQWIAVGIGGLIFLYAIWLYWLDPSSLTADVGSRKVGPSQVDQEVLAGPGQALQNAIRNPRTPPTMGPNTNLDEQVRSRIALDDYTPPQLATSLAPAGSLGAIAGIQLGAEPVGGKITRLPDAPPAQITRLASGRSYAQVVDTGGQGATTDLAEVRVDYRIGVDQIGRAFQEIALPAPNQNTALLRVELERQRRLPDGSWGEDQVIPLLSNNPLPPLPSDGAPEQAKEQFLQTVLAQGQWIIQPAFFELQAGDDPMNLQMVVEVGDDNQPQTRPAAGTIPGGEDADGDQGAGSTPLNPGGSRDGNTVDFGLSQDDPRNQGGMIPPPDVDRTPPGRQTPPARQQPPRQPPVPGGQPGQQTGDAPEEVPVPEGEFNPAQNAGSIEGWAWDTTAVPGETYRYRVVYYIKNPVFRTPAAVDSENAELAQVLAIKSDGGEWSPPITVEPLVYYFLTNTSNDRTQSTFTVYKWQEGKWQGAPFKISPGDPVGYEMNGIDYSTGKTLVDIRQYEGSRQGNFTLLVDDEGRFSRRTVEDARDPKLRELEQEAGRVADNR